MKTKKIVIGAMAATMLSLSVCSVAPAVAAGETVQIKVSETTAEAGGAFTVDVSLADIPSTGLQVCQFSLDYDPSEITITGVKAGALAETGADKVDASAASLPVFNSYIDSKSGLVNIAWSTGTADASYWLNGSGVFCTVSGTVSSSAKDYADIKVVPTNRETVPGSGTTNTSITVGYTKGDAPVKYDTKITDGGVKLGGGSSDTGLKGDANCDNTVTMADAVAILQYMANSSKYPLTEQGIKNGDVDGEAGLSPMDALQIQKYDAGVISGF